MAELATIEEFAAWLGMPNDSGTSGPGMTAILDRAERWLADMCGRPAANPWASASRTEYLDGDLASGVLLTYTPITAVSAVVVTTGASSGTETTASVSTDRLAVDGAPIGGTFTAYTGLLHFRTTGRDRLLGFEWGEPLNYGLDVGPAFPSGHNRIKVTYTGGIVATGNQLHTGAIKQACLELAASIYRRSGHWKGGGSGGDAFSRYWKGGGSGDAFSRQTFDVEMDRIRALAGPYARWRL